MAGIRKLAAILASDVVGYSRLAGADEDRTLARLRALRSDLVDPTVAVHHGRIVKRTGDGSLIEFRSVVDAVRCAIEVQSGMVERNAGFSREAHRVPRRHSFGRHRRGSRRRSHGRRRQYRVATEGQGAERHLRLGRPTEQVRDVAAPIRDSRRKQLKNIARPVHAYRVTMDRNPTNSECGGRKIHHRDFHCRQTVDRGLAVPEYERRSGSGIFCRMELLLRTSSRRFRGPNRCSPSPAIRASRHIRGVRLRCGAQVGRDAGVRYVLEGMSAKPQAQLRASHANSLIRRPTAIFADRFDGSIEEVFELQDQVTARRVVASDDEPALAGAEMERARTKHTSSLTAYDRFLRALAAASHPHEARPRRRPCALPSGDRRSIRTTPRPT